MTKQIVIKRVDVPAPGSVLRDIDFICQSLGYFSQRDKNNTAVKIFRLLVKKSNKGLTSEEIAKSLKITRGAVVYHLNNFIDSGIIIKDKNTYRLRYPSLQKSLEELKYDLDRMFDEINKIAKEIDSRLGRVYR